jgi:translation elongation factor EF-Tu-like GTPase
VEGRFDSQDKTLKKIESKLDEHIETTGQWKAQLTPVVEAFDTMKTGVRVIGRIGDGATWVGKKIVAISLVVASCAALWAAFHDWFK